MLKFVWLEAEDGGQYPVNPAQVHYLQPSRKRETHTEIVFGGVSGGLHSLHVKGGGEAVAAALERAGTSLDPLHTPPATAPQRPRRKPADAV